MKRRLAIGRATVSFDGGKAEREDLSPNRDAEGKVVRSDGGFSIDGTSTSHYFEAQR